MNKRIIKKRKKKKNYYAYADFILIILLIVIIVVLFKPSNKTNSNPNNSNDNNTNNSSNINNNSNNTNNDNNDFKMLSYYKEEYKERYLNYQKKNTNLSKEKTIIYVNIGLDQDFYTNVKDSPNKYTDTVLVNKYNFLGEDYVPKNLTKINTKYAISNDKYMEKNATVAFEEMAKDAKKDGYNVIAVSTYRSYNYQKNLYKNYSNKDGIEKADKYSARAGYSEHQTGLAVDVSNGKTEYTKFGDTKEFKWMQDNCYKYGFILRFTKENEFITGYMNEPWHYRYVGKEIATYIHNNPMTYEEYYVRFLEK